MKEQIEKLNDLAARIKETRTLVSLDQKKMQLTAWEQEMQAPDFWKNADRAKSISKQAEDLRSEIATWDQLLADVEDLLALAKETAQEEDTELAQEFPARIDELTKKFVELEFFVLLSEPHDAENAIVSIHAGTGGVDAQDWAEMLQRMILRFCEKRGWNVSVMHASRAAEAGIKSVTLHVVGRYAYGFLQSENGVHRLVRISPFDAEGMRHTSFALVEVLPELSDDASVEIREEDLRVDTFRSGGHGGQGVNTTDSAVRITHLPTGIVASCQNERSQHQNKEFAMKMLRAKLSQLREQEQQAAKKELRGEYSEAAWGNQIRSYVLQPYQLVKDHRTKSESSNPSAVLDGDLDLFMEAFLRYRRQKNA